MQNISLIFVEKGKIEFKNNAKYFFFMKKEKWKPILMLI